MKGRNQEDLPTSGSRHPDSSTKDANLVPDEFGNPFSSSTLSRLRPVTVVSWHAGWDRSPEQVIVLLCARENQESWRLFQLRSNDRARILASGLGACGEPLIVPGFAFWGPRSPGLTNISPRWPVAPRTTVKLPTRQVVCFDPGQAQIDSAAAK